MSLIWEGYFISSMFNFFSTPLHLARSTYTLTIKGNSILFYSFIIMCLTKRKSFHLFCLFIHYILLSSCSCVCYELHSSCSGRQPPPGVSITLKCTCACSPSAYCAFRGKLSLSKTLSQEPESSFEDRTHTHTVKLTQAVFF